MAVELTDEEIQRFRKILQERFEELKRGVREDLLRSDREHFTDLAGEVHDPEEASVADLVIDTGLAHIDRHISEIRAVEAALLRIGRGDYGSCVDCDQPIPLARLEANPTAERCIACQTDLERAEALVEPPTGQHHRTL
ncbi:TraR/DksA family transcriptional regulator [Candidatus Methylocalor cossyra]|uniref:Transcriptional regulator, TraR/DksA family n=1 Tax=Candidatus Methylocalor cossyra TaxID=3108543 RepID=A0ABM9NH65_9GAMM